MQIVKKLAPVENSLILGQGSQSLEQGEGSDLFENPTAHLFDPALKVNLKAGDYLIHAGQPYTGCYRLERGLVKAVLSSQSGDELITGIYGPNALLGVLSLLDRKPHNASVIALSDCSLSYVTHNALCEHLKRNPDVLTYFVNFLIMCVRQCNEIRAAEAFMTAKQRVGYALLEFSKHAGQKNEDGSTFMREKISQSDLAAMAGVARENVSRVLNDWKKRDLVTLSSRYYCIRDMNALLGEIFSEKN